jgi:hypothetical protein
MRRALVVMAAFPTFAAAQWHQPLDVRNHRTADLAFLRLAPRSHTTSPGGQYLSISLVEANEFRQMGLIDEDAETFRPLLVYGEGLSSGLELFFEVPLVVRGGGFMDAIIEWWHDHLIRRHDPVRASTAKGRSHIEFPGSGGVYGDAVGLGDVTIGVASEVRPRVLARLALKVPTGNPLTLSGSGGFDLGAGVDWRIAFADRWTLDLNGSMVLQGSAPRLNGERSLVHASGISLTWEMNSRDAWTVQWNMERSPTVTGDDGLDGDHRVLSFGYQRRLDDHTVLQLYFSEDGDFLGFPGGPTVGPDLTIAARVFRRT